MTASNCTLFTGQKKPQMFRPLLFPSALYSKCSFSNIFTTELSRPLWDMAMALGTCNGKRENAGHESDKRDSRLSDCLLKMIVATASTPILAQNREGTQRTIAAYESPPFTALRWVGALSLSIGGPTLPCWHRARAAWRRQQPRHPNLNAQKMLDFENDGDDVGDHGDDDNDDCNDDSFHSDHGGAACNS
eukprot:1159188-Pelagomonas_calceolata.AAC.1